MHGGVGSTPSGVAESVIANFPLPASATACEALMPRLGGRQVVIRLYDYGLTSAPGVPSEARIRLGALQPVHDWVTRSRAIAVSRGRFHGRLLTTQSVFGATRPAAALLGLTRFRGLLSLGAMPLERSLDAASASTGVSG